MKTIQYLNKTIHIVSTAHVSKESVLEVKEAIQTVIPDVVCVELDAGRAKALTSSNKTQVDIKQIIKSKKVASFLMNLILSNYQKQIADDLDSEVGGEMKQAILSARELSIPVRYIDRDIQITLKRIWNKTNLWKKASLVAALFSSLTQSEEVSEEDIEKLKQSDLLMASIAELDEDFPDISQVILHERNIYMSEKIKALPFTNILVVIGAAHAPGMIESLNETHSIQELETIPEKKKGWGGYVIPILFALLLVLLTLKSPQSGVSELKRWIILSTSLATLGSIFSFSHPLTVLVTILTTWIGIFSPVLAVGFFSGLTEAYLRPPYEHEFESLSNDMKTIRGWYKNRILRIILIFFATSLLSSIGTLVSGRSIITELIK